MSLGPFDLTGGPFLELYCVLFVLAFMAGLVIPRWLRPEGREGHVPTDPDDLALLTGGVTRHSEAVTARLLSRGALDLGAGGFFNKRDVRAGQGNADAAVLALPQPIKWSAIDRALKPHAEPVRRRLEWNGMLMDGGTAWQLRFWQTSPYLLLLAFGAIKLMVGIEREKPVGILTVLMIATAIFALIRFLVLDRRTRAGKAALAAAQRRADRLQKAPTNDEIPLAVALFGTAVLAGSAFAAFHTMRAASSGDGGGGGDGGGDGGCGGGGCGGCGG